MPLACQIAAASRLADSYESTFGPLGRYAMKHDGRDEDVMLLLFIHFLSFFVCSLIPSKNECKYVYQITHLSFIAAIAHFYFYCTHQEGSSSYER